MYLCESTTPRKWDILCDLKQSKGHHAIEMKQEQHNINVNIIYINIHKITELFKTSVKDIIIYLYQYQLAECSSKWSSKSSTLYMYMEFS